MPSSLEDGDVSVCGEEEDDDGLLVPDGRDLDLQPDGVPVLLVVQRLEGAALRRLHRAVHRACKAEHTHWEMKLSLRVWQFSMHSGMASNS